MTLVSLLQKKSQVPNKEDRRNGISPGFGATINIINGGLECNTKDGKESNQARNRIEYYKQFAWYLYVDTEDEVMSQELTKIRK